MSCLHKLSRLGKCVLRAVKYDYIVEAKVDILKTFGWSIFITDYTLLLLMFFSVWICFSINMTLEDIGTCFLRAKIWRVYRLSSPKAVSPIFWYIWLMLEHKNRLISSFLFWSPLSITCSFYCFWVLLKYLNSWMISTHLFPKLGRLFSNFFNRSQPPFTCSKLTIKAPERRHRPGVFIVNFEQVNAGWGTDMYYWEQIG